jgi:predicted secreted acid phosphatase
VIEAVGFDLDSTIANTYHRQWMVEEIQTKPKFPGQKTWDDYSMACADDTPIEGTVALMRMLSAEAGLLIFIITGRSAAAEALTRHWLNRHHIPCDALVMRPTGDRTANGKFKVEQIRKCADLGYKVTLFVEDYPDAAEYITKHTGIPCLLVNANYPASAPHQNENSRGV